MKTNCTGQLTALRNIVIWVSLTSLGFGQPANKTNPNLRGPYLGQTTPGLTPQIFAPGILNAGLYTRDITMMPDAREIYYCIAVGNYTVSTILRMRENQGRWSTPEVVPWASDARYLYGEPFISPDGRRFFFVSNQPDPLHHRNNKQWDIWVMERIGTDWTAPATIDTVVNSAGDEYFPAVTSGGTLYFTRQTSVRSNEIWRSRLVNGRYSIPEKLPEQVNCGTTRFNAFIAPDESYLIVCAVGMKDTRGATDYYVVFRNQQDQWSEPLNLGDQINTAGGLEFSPYVSPDGKYFFFMSARQTPDFFSTGQPMTYPKLLEFNLTAGNGNPAIWWVSAEVINRLRPAGF